jgi:hypothetical protein
MFHTKYIESSRKSYIMLPIFSFKAFPDPVFAAFVAKDVAVVLLVALLVSPVSDVDAAVALMVAISLAFTLFPFRL